jgi:uncharacterized membrane protein YozB (DUF420 family)
MTSAQTRPATASAVETTGLVRRYQIERVAWTVAFAVAAVLLTAGFATGDRSTGTDTVATFETHPTVPALVVAVLTLVVLLVTQRRSDRADARAHGRAIVTAAGVFLVVTVLATLYLGVPVQSALLGWPGSATSGATPWWSDAVVDSFEVH